MAGTKKKFVEIDIIADTVCPWCFVGKRNLDKALEEGNDRYEFVLRWHPFQIDPEVPKEGTYKREFYDTKMSADVAEVFNSRMADIFSSHDMTYKIDGLTGNSIESHRLIYFAGLQDRDKQHDLVDEICLGYFTDGRFIGDRDYLLECAEKIEIEGAEEFLDDPNKELTEVKEELKKYSEVKGIPYFVINGKEEFAGAQPTEVFLAAFEAATK
ncbi:uncharacterized protein Pyn_14414 [Prunus yedoensis var. nudiflora]|uniref:DSBA-like thioredoxin domain-containing protein n=1 Tax=Prunus yedoensis var. nudiflora TaxID=2094558 RepID=A0A314URD3_PRUYE|nr:uncharacterized protein Pyn_14414 [Prunus yedoensis var. nudiflora]